MNTLKLLAMRSAAVAVAASCFLLLADASRATTITITNGSSEADNNGAIYEWTNIQASGTGGFDSFVRIQNSPSEQGYNSDYRPVEFDEKTDSNFNRSLLITAVPTVTINNEVYRQFVLDLAEPGGPDSLISLNRVEIYLTSNPSITGFNPDAATGTGFGSNASLVYSLDGGDNGDGRVELDRNINGGGNGIADMYLYVRNDLFQAVYDGSNNYVVLYSKFGPAPNSSDSSFEEWAVVKGGGPGLQPVPEPSTYAFVLSGLAAAGLMGLRRRRRS